MDETVDQNIMSLPEQEGDETDTFEIKLMRLCVAELASLDGNRIDDMMRHLPDGILMGIAVTSGGDIDDMNTMLRTLGEYLRGSVRKWSVLGAIFVKTFK